MRLILLAWLVFISLSLPVYGQKVIYNRDGSVTTYKTYGSQGSESFRSKGFILHRRGENDKALINYDKAIQIDPNNGFAYYQRAISQITNREYGKAIDDCTKALELDSVHHFFSQFESASCYNCRGNAFLNNGEYDKAIQDLTQSIGLDPDHVNTYQNRAKAWMKKQEYDKAISDYNRAVQLDPKKDSSYLFRGECWKEMGDYDKAIADFSHAAQLKPKWGPYHAVLARLFASCPEENLRDGKKAVKHAMMACEQTSWKNYDYLAVLASAYAEDGQFEKAVQMQERAIDLAADKDERIKDDLQIRLALYHEHKPYLFVSSKK